MPLLLLSSSSSVMIGRNTSCSSKRNGLVGSCISTFVWRTKSFVADGRDCARGRREGTDLREATAAEPGCCSDGFNKIEQLLGVTGNLDSAPFAPENAVAVAHKGAACDAADLLAAGGGQDEVAYRFVGHPESAPLWAPLSPEFGSERNRLRFRGSSRKKFYELPRQFRRRLLRDVMAAIQGPSLDGFGPLGPVGEGREAARDRCVLAPENEERRDHLAADVGLVVREVDRLGRAVILAARVNRRRIAKASPVLGKRLGREGLQARVAGPHVALDVEIRIGADQGLRNRLGP